MRRIPLLCAIAALLLLGSGGCDKSEPEPAPVEQGLGLKVGDLLEWQAVPSAVEYRVQVWSQMRLLFEQVTTRPRLALTPTMQRSLHGIDSAELRVEALGSDGEPIGETQHQTLGSGGA